MVVATHAPCRAPGSSTTRPLDFSPCIRSSPATGMRTAPPALFCHMRRARGSSQPSDLPSADLSHPHTIRQSHPMWVTRSPGYLGAGSSCMWCSVCHHHGPRSSHGIPSPGSSTRLPRSLANLPIGFPCGAPTLLRTGPGWPSLDCLFACRWDSCHLLVTTDRLDVA